MTLRCTDFLKRHKAHVDTVRDSVATRNGGGNEDTADFKAKVKAGVKTYLKKHPFETSEAAKAACGFCAVAYRTNKASKVVRESSAKCDWAHNIECTATPKVSGGPRGMGTGVLTGVPPPPPPPSGRRPASWPAAGVVLI